MKQELREQVMQLDGGRCRFCGKPATSVHHIKYKSEGVDDTPENLLSLCQGCDHCAHHGGNAWGITGRISAREWVYKKLRRLNHIAKDFRWDDALKHLKPLAEKARSRRLENSVARKE